MHSTPGVDELFARYVQHGERAARDALVKEFLPLAHKLARRYVRSTEPHDDLMQVASLGLIKAIDRFDPSRGPSFASFAIPTILGELRRHFRDATWAVHVPRGAQERAQAIDAASERLTNERGSAPTVDEIAAELRLTPDEVLDGLLARRAYEAESLERPDSRDDGEAGLSVLDLVGSEDARYALIEEHTVVIPALRQLSERERRVLYLRYVTEMSQREIANEIGVSQMQVSRILAATIAKLRELGGVHPG
ncbi:MAG TPA: SigB/SigF/SigG family RNA polymerase sigma factor [Solirubrobacteraceae bacterium]|nr:SigB/SigF/SigG family RNA polymerase sigma factor [Solirubrobacteraceae bacterium]